MPRRASCLLVVGLLLAAAHDARAVEPRVTTLALTEGTRDGTVLDDRQRVRLARSGDGHLPSGTFVSAPVDLGGSGTTTVAWREQWTAPQTWRKHPGNPIYGPAQSGAWDDWTNGVAIVRDKGDVSYKMFYAGRKGAGIGFAVGSLADPLTWKEHPASPVLVPRTDNWEGGLINQPRVVKVTDEHWRMYYTGWGHEAGGGSPWTFGLAESFDAGVTWQRHADGRPLLERGPPGSYDDGGVFVPEVRRVGRGWMMWYTAMKVIPGRQAIHICAATSDDGVRWTKCDVNPVITDDFTTGPARNVISRCHVRVDDGVFRMWYTHGRPDYRIRYAESLDGLHFERSPIDLALDASADADAWDGRMVEYPTIDVVDGRWRMWFCGNGFGGVGYASGVVETGVRLFIRGGDTAVPDDSWTAWTAVARGDGVGTGRFVQVKAELRSENPLLSPALNEVSLGR